MLNDELKSSFFDIYIYENRYTHKT